MRAGLVLLAAAAACSGGDDPPPPEVGDSGAPGTDSGTTSSSPPFDPVIETTDNGDGTFTTLVQATHGEEWVYLSLGGGGVRVQPEDPENSDAWDLKFRRDKIYLNGGVNGAGGGEAAVLPGIALESVVWPAAGGYVTDTPDEDGDGYPQGPFIGWFLYDITTHVLTADDRSYVLRAPGGTFRMRLLSYYHPEGQQSGWPSFVWAPLDPAEAGPLTAVDEPVPGLRADTTGPDPVYVALAEQIALRPADPGSSAEWDVAVLPLALPSNGGTSGIGGRTVAAVEAPFDAVTEAPPPGAFVEDGAAGEAISGWYADEGGGPVPVPDRTFVVRRPVPEVDDGDPPPPVDVKLAVVGLDEAGMVLRTEVLAPPSEE